jgi:hypothetical protein
MEARMMMAKKAATLYKLCRAFHSQGFGILILTEQNHLFVMGEEKSAWIPPHQL